MRLDLALIGLHKHLSRRRAREAIEKGQVEVDGEVVREAGRSVSPAAVVTWDPNRRALPRARLSLPTLYSDAALVIVDKPAGLLSVPSTGGAGEDTVVERVRDYARRLQHRPYVRAVHRLDRDTSGALCVALGRQAADGLITLFRDHRVERLYLALVQGVPRADSGSVDAPIADAYVSGRRRVARAGEPSRPALTRWRVVERFPGTALVEVELATGRQHQIRLHLAHAGMPVLGDAVYREGARPAPLVVKRQMLHARLLAFAHPLTSVPVRAESPVPPDLEQALSTLRRRLG